MFNSYLFIGNEIGMESGFRFVSPFAASCDSEGFSNNFGKWVRGNASIVMRKVFPKLVKISGLMERETAIAVAISHVGGLAISGTDDFSELSDGATNEEFGADVIEGNGAIYLPMRITTVKDEFIHGGIFLTVRIRLRVRL